MTMCEEGKSNVRGQRPLTSRNGIRGGSNKKGQFSKRYIKNLNSRLSERSLLPAYSIPSTKGQLDNITSKSAVTRYRSTEKRVVSTGTSVPKSTFSSHLKDLNTAQTVFKSYQ